MKKVEEALEKDSVKEAVLATLNDLNVCSQKGLVEMFDASIGAGSVFMPYGGKYQLTETQTMVAKLPVLKGKTDTVTMMAYGFDPYLSSWSPYHGAIYAVTESMAKIVAAGGDYTKIRFTFQEYFRRMTEEDSRWSQPFAALLARMMHRLAMNCLRLVERIRCRAHSIRLMCAHTRFFCGGCRKAAGYYHTGVKECRGQTCCV